MEETIECRGPCKKKTWPKFGRSSFLRHISQAMQCKSFYTDEEFENFQQVANERKKDFKRKRAIETYDSEERSLKYQKFDKQKYDPKKEKRNMTLK